MEKSARAARGRFVGVVAALIILAAILFVIWTSNKKAAPQPSEVPVSTSAAKKPVGGSTIHLYAHNLRLHQGPDFRVYIQWLRGSLETAKKNVVASFDDPDSFYLNITNGVIRANLGDICNYLNARNGSGSLQKVNMVGQGTNVKITASVHRLLTFPVELDGTISPASNNRIQIHISKISVLKIPMKGMLNSMHLQLSDLIHSPLVEGVEISGNDIFFNPQELLPPPHIRGNLTSVSLASPDLIAVYGNVTKDLETVEQWRNFLRLRDGTLRFGKLTMTGVDLLMIDVTQDDWFDLDLTNYQQQLIHGYTRITPKQGLQIFMPDYSVLKNAGLITPTDTSVQWMKNRNVAPPKAVVPKN